MAGRAVGGQIVSQYKIVLRLEEQALGRGAERARRGAQARRGRARGAQQARQGRSRCGGSVRPGCAAWLRAVHSVHSACF